MHNCIFCNHSMAEVGSRMEVRNGEARKLTEFECTNPSCKAPKVVDRPYEI